MGTVIITICIAASLVLTGIGLVIKMLLGLKRDIAVNRAVLRASLAPPAELPPLSVFESESEKNERRHGMHIVRSGPVTVLGALIWRARRHMWRTASISGAAVGFGTLMIAVFALGTPTTPARAPAGGHLPTIGATEPAAAPSTAPLASSPSTVAASSPPTNSGAQTVMVVAAAESSTLPAPIPTPTLPASVPSLSTVKAPIVVSSSISTCMATAAVPGVLGVCVL